MSQESHIDTRTPEEMYRQAFARITSIGNAIVKANGWKHQYLPLNMATYQFSFDKSAIYHFHGRSNDGFYFYFRRNSDFAALIMTKYSEPPQEVKV